MYFRHFCLLFDRTVDRQETQLERERERERVGGGGGDRERSASQDSNTGRPKHNGATCRHAAHKAIGADCKVYFNSKSKLRNCIYLHLILIKKVKYTF